MAVSIPKQLAAAGITSGLSIALVDDQKVVWVQSFGYSDVASGTLATPNTVYRIASISKTFTAAMILQLYEQGKVGLDDPLTKYIPTFSMKPPLGFPAGGPVTIRTMLTHHNGITGEIFNGAITQAPDPNFNAELVTELQGEYLQYPTNYFYAYSNSAVSLLGTVIEQASGQSLLNYSNALFNTLGMDNTSLSIDSANVHANLATGYTGGQALPRYYYANMGGSGAIVSTIQDMAKYAMMINAEGAGQRGQALQPVTVDMMLTEQNAGVPLDFDEQMGFLWDLNDASLSYAGKTCWKEGQINGFHTWIEFMRDYKLGVVVLANDDQAPVYNIASQTLQLALWEKNGKLPPAAAAPVNSPQVTWNQSRLDALQGIYTIQNMPPYILVSSVPGALNININGTITKVVPKADGWFSAPGPQTAEYEFTQVSGKNVIVAHTGGQSLLFGEYYGPPAISAAWAARVGNYQATNWTNWSSAFPAEAPVLSIQNGMLVMDANVLHPVSDTLAYVEGFSNYGGESVQVLNPGPNEQIQVLGVTYKKQ